MSDYKYSIEAKNVNKTFYKKSIEVLNIYLELWESGNKYGIQSKDAARGYFLRGVNQAMFSKKKQACKDFQKAKITNSSYVDKVNDNYLSLRSKN